MYQITMPERPFSADDLTGIRNAILQDVLLGKLDPALALPQAAPIPFQLLLLCTEPVSRQIDPELFTRLHLSASTAIGGYDLIRIHDHYALLLWGNATIQKCEEMFQQWQAGDHSINRTLQQIEPFVLVCHPVSSDPQEIPLAYRRACERMQQHFFFHPNQPLLRMESAEPSIGRMPAINILMTEQYAQKLLQCIQAFNRTMCISILSELEDILHAGADSPEAIRLFFIDLYLQIKEQMRYLYQGYTIPFYTNGHIIQTILQAPHLSDITCFLAQRFDMIMASIGASSQESVLDSILYYIQHNFTSSITLESIAPLFGYNHSYLGKIFRKKMQISFNEYIDHLRIEHSKELLLQTNAKVYTISKQVGYKNVDYFHVKFRKYTGMSPVEFRKANQPSLHSPDGENAQKDILLQD